MRNKKSTSLIIKKTIPIVYEDNSLCIVNKPFGLAVQGGAGITVSLIDILQKQLNIPIFPVHRIDKETTGLLVMAKSAAAACECRTLFDSHTVKKEYIATSFVDIPLEAAIFKHNRKKHLFHNSKKTSNTAPSIGTESSTSDYRIINTPIQEQGRLKKACTEYKIIAKTQRHGIFSIRLHTGRQHQIRIHLASAGYPIIGDDKHGNFAHNKELWKKERIKKLQLCAYRIEIPINGKPLQCSIPLPPHIETAVQQLFDNTTLSIIKNI